MSSQTDSSLDVRDLMKRAYVAAPCPVKWADMKGDEKRRLCAQCDCYVLKATEMTDEEVIEAITRAASGQRVCMQFYKRADGTLLTKNCPVGLAALQSRARQVVKSVAGTLALILSSLLGTARADEGINGGDCLSAGGSPYYGTAPDTAGDTFIFKERWHGSIRSGAISPPSDGSYTETSAAAPEVEQSKTHQTGYIAFSSLPDQLIAKQKETVQSARQQFGGESLQLGWALATLAREQYSRQDYRQGLKSALEALQIFETNKSWRQASGAAGSEDLPRTWRDSKRNVLREPR